MENYLDLNLYQGSKMDRDTELLANLIGIEPRDLTLANIRGLVGKAGSMSSIRSGISPVKCVIKAIEIDHDIKLIVQSGKQTIRRHISKFSWEVPEKKIFTVKQDPENIKCSCGQYFKKNAHHRRECPIHILGLDRPVEEMDDLIDED